MERGSGVAAWARGMPATRLARGPSRLLELAPAPDEPARVHVQWALELAVSELIATRLSRRDPWRADDVHRARVAVRRVRALLNMYGPLLDPTQAESRRAELLVVGAALARVRKIDSI